MADATIFTKTLTAGDHKTLVLEPGMEFKRETNFPLNWLKLRLGFIGSFTNLVSTNGTPTAETVANNGLGPLFGFNFGMSNGVGYIGQAGNRFIGVGTRRNGGAGTGLWMETLSSNWGIGSSDDSPNNHMGNLIGDGTTVGVGTQASIGNPFRVNDPTAAASCMFSWCVELDLTQGGAGVNTPTYAAFPADSPLSAASDEMLVSRLNAFTYTAFVGSGGGGWWDQTGSTPNGCTFLSIRCPLTLNRLRIHNLLLQQLA